MKRRRFIGGAIAGTSLLSAGKGSGLSLRSHQDVMLNQGEVHRNLIAEDLIREIIQIAIDTATDLGSTYTDVRITHSRKRIFEESRAARQNTKIDFGYIYDREEISIGIRTLKNGYWGFSSGPVLDKREAARLALEAFRQSDANDRGLERVVELVKIDRIDNEKWATPIAIDPFAIHPNEILDIFGGILEYGRYRPGCYRSFISAAFQAQTKTFGSSEGSYFTQHLNLSKGGACSDYEINNRRDRIYLDTLTPAGVGFEMFDEKRIREEIDLKMEEVRFNSYLPMIPIEVGRYETVLDAHSVAAMLADTIGSATELDRALGYEANASGTSYLNKPADMIGSEVIAAPSINVTAERSMPNGAATVRWDDEGVRPISNQIITNGILTEFQTTRESASWSGGRNISSGCAYSQTAINPPLSMTANIRLIPSDSSTSFTSFVEGLEDGFAVKRMNTNTDFQQSSGLGTGFTYQVKKGKIASVVVGAGILFKASEFWKSVSHIGSKADERAFGVEMAKGEPEQSYSHTVSAVPIVCESLTFIDIKRKA